MSIPAAVEQSAQALVAACSRPQAALHPLLDLAMSEAGPWTDDVADWVADMCQLPVAVVRGVASSRHNPVPGCIEVCTGLSCRWMGADRVLDRLQQLDDVEVATVDCLGVCSAAPAMRRGDRLHDGLTQERLEALVAGGG